MLTDEDIGIETNDFFGGPLENPTILKNLGNEFQLKFQTEQQNGYIQSQDLDFEKEHFGNTTIDDILKECFKDSDINDVYSIDTPEQLSPYSNGRISLDNEVPVIHIPDEDLKRGIDHVLSDTPPHTPPSLMEQVSYSPPKNSSNSIVVSLNTVPAMTYVVPATQLQPVIKPIKPRVNIKPKPTSSDPSIIRLNSNEDQTTEQIVKLPNRIFCVKEPVSCITKPTTQSVSIPPSNCIDGKNGINKCQLIEVCSAALKRKERIIKNRESASLSRKRRREYVQKLEGALNQVTAENANLKEENNTLKCKIIALQNEISKLKGAFLSKGVKKGMFYMFAICLVTYNVASIGSIFTKDIKPIKTDIGNNNHRVGRILLWNEENSSREMNSSRPLFHNFLKEEENSHYIVAWDKSDNFSTCQQFINKTESLRLENDLLGWVKRVEKKQKQKESKLKKESASIKTTIPPLPKLQQLGSKYRNGRNDDIWAKRKNRNEILIYQTPRKDYEEFFEALHRRDDSFYFISFSGDHLLLPAIAHNHTLRPRMSFVMPAMILNDSLDDADGIISMMQIDCEVMDTKLVHIKESVIPLHLRQKSNNSTKTNSKNYSEYSMNRNPRRILDSSVKLSNKNF